MDIEEIIGTAVRRYAELPHGLKYGLYDYSGYPGDLPPHVVRSPNGDVVLRTHDGDEAQATYERFSLKHAGEYVAKALEEAGYAIASQGRLNGS